MYSLEGGHAFKVSEKDDYSGISKVHKNNGQYLLKAKINIFLKKLYAWGRTNHYDLSREEFMISPLCEVA